MPGSPYAHMQALIVDDFDSFRITLSKMLQEFGIGTVDTVSSGAEALICASCKHYDIILCDQNLGKGKTGQQVLESLRQQTYINHESLFVLISAESNKNIIMAAYDYEPDAYLAKPFTRQALSQRLDRLFKQRIALAAVYKALGTNELQTVVGLCEKEITAGSRYAGLCQKMLGKVYFRLGEFEKAENLYRSILDVRQLDWAMLGMAQAKKCLGDSLSAQQWLEEIIQVNPQCLKAYDLLADIHAERADHQYQQAVLEQAVQLSPLSILRQQALGDIAYKNNDYVTAVTAYRKAVKLGENSCHDKVHFHERFARGSIQLAKSDKSAAAPFLREALKIVMDIPLRFGKTDESKAMSHLLESQLLWTSGEERLAYDSVTSAQKIMNAVDSCVSLETEIELIKVLRDLGRRDQSEKFIITLLDKYANEEEKLQQIDRLMDEPRSEKNKALITKINRDGIAFFDAKNFVSAIDCFSNALNDFPQHIGIGLNLVQALLEQAKHEGDTVRMLMRAQQVMESIKLIIDVHHQQYNRFRQLEDMLRRR